MLKNIPGQEPNGTSSSRMGISVAIVNMETCDIQEPVQIFNTHALASNADDLINYLQSLSDQVSHTILLHSATVLESFKSESLFALTCKLRSFAWR